LAETPSFFCLDKLKKKVVNKFGYVKNYLYLCKRKGKIAQLVEHGTEDAGVGGSNPSLPTNMEQHRSRYAMACIRVTGDNGPFV